MKYLAISLLFLLAFITSCTVENDSNEDTPPILPNVYGTLINYNITDEKIDLKINSSVINYKYNNSILSLNLNREYTACCYRNLLFGKISYEANSKRTVEKVNDLEIGKEYCLNVGICGNLIEIYNTKEVGELAHNKKLIFNITKLSPELIVGRDYVFYFSSNKWDEMINYAGISHTSEQYLRLVEIYNN